MRHFRDHASAENIVSAAIIRSSHAGLFLFDRVAIHEAMIRPIKRDYCCNLNMELHLRDKIENHDVDAANHARRRLDFRAPLNFENNFLRNMPT